MSTIKISPVPRNVTEDQVRSVLGTENVDKVIINGDNAFVSLPNPNTLEKLAGTFGDDLKVGQWGATIDPLDSTFDFSSLKPDPIAYPKLGEVGQSIQSGLAQSQNLIGNVVEGVKDIIGSGVSTQIGPTVNFREYNQKLGNIVNILLAIWLVLLLH